MFILILVMSLVYLLYIALSIATFLYLHEQNKNG
jgi:hypothetical protein